MQIQVILICSAAEQVALASSPWFLRELLPTVGPRVIVIAAVKSGEIVCAFVMSTADL